MSLTMTNIDTGVRPIDCPVCFSVDCGQRPFPGASDVTEYVCPRCGAFALTGTAAAVLPHQFEIDPIRRALMSHKLRRMHQPECKTVWVASDSLDVFWIEGRLPTPQQQVDSLILWIGDNQPSPDSHAQNTSAFIAAWVGGNIPRAGNPSEPGLIWLFNQAPLKAFFERQHVGDKDHLQLTIAGWKKYADLKKIQIESRTAFMAMRFGQPELNNVVDTCFRRAVERTGFELRVLTDQQPAGLIDNQIRASIMSGRFVIADLTHGSHRAYWEAGFAEGFGLPVIYTCAKSQWDESKTHFDTNHLLTIVWDTSDLQKAENELAATIRATLRHEAKQSDG
jgi:hypothetical protein